jgi:glycosyltransferase involved in cell wall biosynthesis
MANMAPTERRPPQNGATYELSRKEAFVMTRKVISILAPKLSGNSMGRAYLLAKMLQGEFDVHIVGFGAGDIWEPIAHDRSIEYRPYEHRTISSFLGGARSTARRLVDGNLILALKPHLTSFGLGLIARRVDRRPLLLDIDDWEKALLGDSPYWELRADPRNWLLSTTSPLPIRLLDRQVHRADAITVSNRLLQRRYGGTWIPHAHDEQLFAPLDPSPQRSPPTVMFVGTARVNKGLDQLLTAWRLVENPAAVLRIVGTPTTSRVLEPIVHLARSPRGVRRRAGTVRPAARIARRGRRVRGSASRHTASRGQLPMKLIAAMATGRAIVSTAVGDIPDWLADGAGRVVKAGDPTALADAINSLLAQPDAAAEMGRRARRRYLEFGSFRAVRPRLVRLCADLIAGRPLEPPARVFDETLAAAPAP